MKQMIKLNNDRYRLGYHVSALAGWINDPNGFCYYKAIITFFTNTIPTPLTGVQCIGDMPAVKTSCTGKVFRSRLPLTPKPMKMAAFLAVRSSKMTSCI